MSKKLNLAVGVVVLAAITLGGATCWRLARFRGFDLSACEDGYTYTGALVPSFDYAEHRDTSQPGQATDPKGEKCRSATDKEACLAKFASTSSTTGWGNGSHGRMPGRHYIVATRGNDVTVIDSPRALATALAPVDSPLKAAAIASLERGISAACKNSVRKVEGGFEVHLLTESCLGPAEEVVRVDADGSVTVIMSEHGDATCVG